MADDNPEENVHGGNDDVPPPEPKAMSIRFADTNNNELVFKLRSTTKLKKAMDTYAQHKGLQRHTLRFIFEGDRILDDHTPEFFQMDEGDMVEVHIEQLGGGEDDDK